MEGEVCSSNPKTYEAKEGPLLLCAKRFPLLATFEDLEQTRSNSYFIRLSDSPYPSGTTASSILASFLRNQKNGINLDCNEMREGFTFIEVERGTQLRSSSECLRMALLRIMSTCFLKPLSFATEVPHETFQSLIKLCKKHKHLVSFMVDLIVELMEHDSLVGISFMSRLVNLVSEGEKTNQQPQDDLESAMAIIAGFSLRIDGIVIAGLYLGRLLPALRNESAAVRKNFCDILCSCISRYDLLCSQDQEYLAVIHALVLRDKDALCRSKALANLAASCITWVRLSSQKTLHMIMTLILERVLDRSKVVRLKALQVLEVAILDMQRSPTREFSLNQTHSEIISKLSKLLLISSDSAFFCKETMEAAGNILCLEFLGGPTMVEHLDILVNSKNSLLASSLISKILHSHVRSYEEWVQFLVIKSDGSITGLQKFLRTTLNHCPEFSSSSRLSDMVNRAFQVLKHHSSSTAMQELDNTALLGSCMLITLFMSVAHIELASIARNTYTLLLVLQRLTKNGSLSLHMEPVTTAKLSKWALKALAATIKGQQVLPMQALRCFIKSDSICITVDGVHALMDCIYGLKNPFGLIKDIVDYFEEERKVLEAPQPVNLLQCYICFLGDTSRVYDVACQSFVRHLRNARRVVNQPPIFDNSFSDYDYLQQEEQKDQEEDAVLRFSQMLLDGDSVPGCYVPFLKEVALSDTLPLCLRIVAVQSLGQFLLTSNLLARDNKTTLELLLQSREASLKVSALKLAQDLIVTFPNDFIDLLSTLIFLLKDETVAEAAFSAYVYLMLEEKFKVEMLLGPVCDVLCQGRTEKVVTLALFLLRRLLRDAARSKQKLVINLYCNCSDTTARQSLARVLVQEFLDNSDLRSDALATSFFHMLTLGQNDAAYFISFLHPSAKSLQTLMAYLNAKPPKLDLAGNPDVADCLIQFVNNHKRHRMSATEKELVGNLLEKLQSNPKKRKRKQAIHVETMDSSYQSVEDFEKAVKTFKHRQVSSSIWDFLRHDV